MASMVSAVLDRAGSSARTDPRRSQRVAFVAWGSVPGRSEEIARALGGRARCFFPPRTSRPPAAVRYVLSALATVAWLAKERPNAVIVTNPPVFAGLVAYICSRVLGAPLVLDSHPGGFGVQGDRISARLQPMHRWLARRAEAVLVTDETWRSKVESWGGHGVIVHEALPGWECPPPRRHQRLSVLVVGRLAADEPTGEVLAAARALPGCDFAITGEPTRLDPAVRSSAPPNVTFVGFLGKENYRDRLAASDAVVTLTTEPTSVMRAAYEAVYARRPVVLSDWPLCAELFPHALRCSNDSVGIADALRRLDADYESMVAKLDVARRRQVARWEGQRRKLEEKIAGSP